MEQLLLARVLHEFVFLLDGVLATWANQTALTPEGSGLVSNLAAVESAAEVILGWFTSVVAALWQCI